MTTLVQLDIRKEPVNRSISTVGWIVIATSLLAIIALVVTLRYDMVLAYKDAMAHLAIARRTVLGTSPGFGQFGGVWPPLPHFLVLPFIGIDFLYYSGIAGAIVSMAAYVVTVVMIYKIVYDRTRHRFPSIVGASVFGLNVPMLYLQATPMTESVLFCTLAMAVFAMQRWAGTNDARYLVGAALAVALATLTRYESWIFLGLLWLSVLVITQLQLQPEHLPANRLRHRHMSRIILFTLPAFAGVVGWMLWNLVIFGDPFNFQTSDYAKPPLEPNEPAVGNADIAFSTYGYAMEACVGWIILALGAAGFVAYAIRELRVPRTIAQALPVLALLPVLLFFVYAAWAGQRPLHVEQINGEMYNVRYGMIALLPAAIFIGHLANVLKRDILRYAAGTVVLALVVFTGVATLQNDGVNRMIGIERPTDMSAYTAEVFEGMYDGGFVLMESWFNENVAYESVPAEQLIYEGSRSQWGSSLGNPNGNDIRWIIMRCGQHADVVCRQVNPDQVEAHYVLEREIPDPQMNDVLRIYRQR